MVLTRLCDWFNAFPAMQSWQVQAYSVAVIVQGCEQLLKMLLVPTSSALSLGIGFSTAFNWLVKRQKLELMVN